MAVWTTARARTAMVGPSLVCWMVSRTCWFQPRTTLSRVAAPAGATPPGAAVNPTLTAKSTAKIMGSLRAAMAQPPQTLYGPELGRARGQGEAVEPADSSPTAFRNKIDLTAATV